MNAVSDAHRKGDKNPDSKVLAETMKLVGNSGPFGRSDMDKTKHKDFKYQSDENKISTAIEHFNFHHLEPISGDIHEITNNKR
jgi:hypothetical protein